MAAKAAMSAQSVRFLAHLEKSFSDADLGLFGYQLAIKSLGNSVENSIS